MAVSRVLCAESYFITIQYTFWPREGENCRTTTALLLLLLGT